ncbi:hypothetical protein EBU71_01265 [bacterium]|jgi:hypothetical protein|nr:hypothetical protein [Candidatus Elulimicrobium humile]
MIAQVNQAIDTLSNAQRSLVETFIKDSKVAEPVNNIIDASQTFSKTLAKSFVNLGETFVSAFSKGSK